MLRLQFFAALFKPAWLRTCYTDIEKHVDAPMCKKMSASLQSVQTGMPDLSYWLNSCFSRLLFPWCTSNCKRCIWCIQDYKRMAVKTFPGWDPLEDKFWVCWRNQGAYELLHSTPPGQLQLSGVQFIRMSQYVLDSECLIHAIEQPATCWTYNKAESRSNKVLSPYQQSQLMGLLHKALVLLCPIDALIVRYQTNKVPFQKSTLTPANAID